MKIACPLPTFYLCIWNKCCCYISVKSRFLADIGLHYCLIVASLCILCLNQFEVSQVFLTNLMSVKSGHHFWYVCLGVCSSVSSKIITIYLLFLISKWSTKVANRRYFNIFYIFWVGWGNRIKV